LALLLIGLLAPAQAAWAADPAHATGTCTGGQSCYNKDADHTTFVNSNGQNTGIYCSADVITAVYSSGLNLSGTNGTVKVELRWSARCTANWSRATIVTANGSSRQLGAKASPTNSGYYKTAYYHANGGLLSSGTRIYTLMVDGSNTVFAYAGINSSVCSGTNNTGFPCNYNPLASYSG